MASLQLALSHRLINLIRFVIWKAILNSNFVGCPGFLPLMFCMENSHYNSSGQRCLHMGATGVIEGALGALRHGAR